MKTSLSRSIVNFFRNFVFSKQALLSFTLITFLTSNLSLYCMESDAQALLREAEQVANTLGPAGGTAAKVINVVATTAVIASNVDLGGAKDAIKETYDSVAKPVSTNPHGEASHNLEISGNTAGQIGIQGLDSNPVLEEASDSLAPSKTQFAPQEKSQDKATEIVKTTPQIIAQPTTDIQTTTNAATQSVGNAHANTTDIPISKDTLQLNQTGNKVVDPIVPILNQQKAAATADSMNAGQNAQALIDSNKATVRAATRASNDIITSLNRDKVATLFYVQHLPPSMETFDSFFSGLNNQQLFEQYFLYHSSKYLVFISNKPGFREFILDLDEKLGRKKFGIK